MKGLTLEDYMETLNAVEWRCSECGQAHVLKVEKCSRCEVNFTAEALKPSHNTGCLEIKLPNRGAFLLCAVECGIKASVARKLLKAILQHPGAW